MTTRDYACVIHGDAYGWIYVDRLYNMLQAHSTQDVRLHVFTEAGRYVPEPFVKHVLIDWPGIAGPRKAWWYKMQMFNSQHFSGRLLYFDLDVVLTKNIDWMWELADPYFWAVRDFKYLWRPGHNEINSSVMLWDTVKYQWIWDEFSKKNIQGVVKQYHGDQDFLTAVLTEKTRRFFNQSFIQSWRWEIKDGGLDMISRQYRQPGAGSVMNPANCVIVFHGKPKPHETEDSVVDRYWQVTQKAHK